MATLFKSVQSQNARPPVTVSQAGQIVSLRAFYSLAVALVVNDTIQLAKIPAGMLIEDMAVDIDSLDSNASPTIIPQFGILNAAGTALAGPVLLGITAANSKLGGLFRPTLLEMSRIGSKNVDRYLGMLVQTVPATGTAPTAVTLNRGKWAAGTVYASGDYLILANGATVKCTSGGTSGATEPEFVATNAGTTTDGGVTWTCASILIGVNLKLRNANFGA